MEKMEVNSVSKTETPIKTVVKKNYKWIDNNVDGVKTCEACGAEMRGWAYRQNFIYCPMCGEKMDG